MNCDAVIHPYDLRGAAANERLRRSPTPLQVDLTPTDFTGTQVGERFEATPTEGLRPVASLVGIDAYVAESASMLAVERADIVGAKL